nr:reverse transcriptase domain-containing protein [Tanacetum cinerariifolium]
PLYFKGTEGVVKLTQWFERMEMVFRISKCLAENQVKFATCTLLAGALTWWNSHVRIVGTDAAYVMTWIELKKKMEDKYCPRNKMKKIETELWNLEVQELKKKMADKYCPRNEMKKIETTLLKITKADSSLLKGKMWQGHTLQDLEIGNSMQGLDLCAPNAISTMTIHVFQDATSATRLAT